MGKITGFLGDSAGDAGAAAGCGAPEGLARARGQAPRGQAAAARRALHGLRHPLLPQGLPAREHHSRLERPGVPRPLEGRDRPAPFRRTTSRSSPAASAPRRAKKRASSTSTTTRSRSSRSRSRSSTTPSKKAGSPPVAAEPANRQAGRGRRIGSGRARGRRAAESRRPHRRGLRARRPDRRPADATASPTSSSRSRSSSAGSDRCARRASSST